MAKRDATDRVRERERERANTETRRTFLLLGAAEAAGGFLELVAVNFDHPEWAEDLGQVGGLVTAGKRDLNGLDKGKG